MQNSDLEVYCRKAVEAGVNSARVINPGNVVTAAWVRLKCQWGCKYKLTHCCPPETPTPKETREILDCYRRAILCHTEAPMSPERGKRMVGVLKNMVDLEGEMFKDGYYKAFVLLAGPCVLCRECGKKKGADCSFPDRARPSMESFGIDVFQTAWDHGLTIRTLRDKSEPQNLFFLFLVD
jgi:predicted metal-binding protein